MITHRDLHLALLAAQHDGHPKVLGVVEGDADITAPQDFKRVYLEGAFDLEEVAKALVEALKKRRLEVCYLIGPSLATEGEAWSKVIKAGRLLAVSSEPRPSGDPASENAKR